MIEINLLETKKPFKLPTILGVDLGEINFRLAILAYVISYLPGLLFLPQWEEEKLAIEEKVKKTDAIFRKLQKKTRGQANFKAQLEEFARQEKKLEAKLAVVKQIIEKRKNPMSIMLYLTKNIPKDVWLIDMNIKDDLLVITGKATNYPSMSEFLKKLQNSVFFVGMRLKTTDTVTEGNNVRYEKFIFEGKIKRYD